MDTPVNALIVGGGIGGLSAALALSQAGQRCAVFEQAAQFSELGAGLQLSPNAMRVLHRLGLRSELSHIASFPTTLRIRSAKHGALLGALPLGAAMVQRYGAPYATIHRADLHTLLLKAVRQTSAHLHTNAAFSCYDLNPTGMTIDINGIKYTGDYLIGADGLRSAVRQQYLHDGAATATGHLVYRALVLQSALPSTLRSQDITVWLAPNLHVVAYPVQGGRLLNIAVIMHGQLDTPAASAWGQNIHAHSVYRAIQARCHASSPLMQLIDALCDDTLSPNSSPAVDWRVWAVYDRAPVCSAKHMANGEQRVALLGDAAHPMRPYLAQGAAMAIEDAAHLAHTLQAQSGNIGMGFNAYAASRWQRCAKVQARARRNGDVFHAQGALRFARDAGIQLLGQRILDMPWMYGV